MRISVLGIGYVGAVSCGCLAASGHEIVGVDIAPEKVAMLARGQSPIVEDEIDRLIAQGVGSGRLRATTSIADAVANTEVSFISVGTPSGPDGSVSLRAVDEVVASIGRELRGKPGVHTVVMRSTVPPGTAEDRVIPMLEQASGKRHGEGFRYLSNPEFLREGSSVRDFHAPPYTLIGAAPGDDGDGAAGDLCRRWGRGARRAVSRGGGGQVPRQRLSCGQAGLCQRGRGDSGVARGGCPGRLPAVLRGPGAERLACLPDARLRVRRLLPAQGHPQPAGAGRPGERRCAPFLNQVLPSNHAIIERTFGAIAAHGRQTVALFGLAFKQGTDDLRESPFVILAERLLGRGYDLRIFDRSVQVARLTGSNRAYIEREIPHLERLLVPGACGGPGRSRAGGPGACRPCATARRCSRL